MSADNGVYLEKASKGKFYKVATFSGDIAISEQIFFETIEEALAYIAETITTPNTA